MPITPTSEVIEEGSYRYGSAMGNYVFLRPVLLFMHTLAFRYIYTHYSSHFGIFLLQWICNFPSIFQCLAKWALLLTRWWKTWWFLFSVAEQKYFIVASSFQSRAIRTCTGMTEGMLLEALCAVVLFRPLFAPIYWAVFPIAFCCLIMMV